MQPTLQAVWNSRINNYRARVNKDCGAEVEARLIRIRDNWASDVRVDTAHYQETVQATEPEMTTATSGKIAPPFEQYFYYNEYGTARMSARPSMRQAIAAEQNNFTDTLMGILGDIGL